MAKIYQGNAIIAEENTVLSGRPASEKFESYTTDLSDRTGNIYQENGETCGLDPVSRAERIEELDEVIYENLHGDNEE